MLIRFADLLHKPFLDVADTGGAAGAEESEVAEPTGAEETVGVEETEVAEQSTGKTDADARFAQMRRELEQAKADKQALEDALGNFFDGDTESKVIQAQAYAQGKTEEEIRAEIEAENEHDRLEQELEQANDELLSYKAKAQMDEDLKAIQAIDPTVKDLDSLGEDYLAMISTGKCSAVQAYYATKAKQAAEKAVPPEAPGKVNAAEGPKDYYTYEEVAAMSPAEVRKNYDTIRKSMAKWGE